MPWQDTVAGKENVKCSGSAVSFTRWTDNEEQMATKKRDKSSKCSGQGTKVVVASVCLAHFSNGMIINKDTHT